MPFLTPYSPINTLAGEHLTPEFLKINPQHCVPTLVDGDYVIWESYAICAYLGSKYSKTLCPNDNLELRGLIDQRLHYTHGTLFARYYGVIRTIFRDQAIEFRVESHLLEIEQALEFLEIFLSQSEYVAGKHLTVADILCVPTVSSIFAVLEVDASKFPKVGDWVKRLSKELPSFDEIEIAGVAKMRSLLLNMIEKNKAALKNAEWVTKKEINAFNHKY